MYSTKAFSLKIVLKNKIKKKIEKKLYDVYFVV